MRLRIRELREERGWTQATLAAKAGVSRSYLSELETGTKAINDRRIVSIANALDVEFIALFDLSEASPRFQRLLRVYLSLPSHRRDRWIELAEAMGASLLPDEGDPPAPPNDARRAG